MRRTDQLVARFTEVLKDKIWMTKNLNKISVKSGEERNIVIGNIEKIQVEYPAKSGSAHCYLKVLPGLKYLVKENQHFMLAFVKLTGQRSRYVGSL